MEKNITCRPDKPSCKASKSLSTKVKYSVFIEPMRTYVPYCKQQQNEKLTQIHQMKNMLFYSQQLYRNFSTKYLETLELTFRRNKIHVHQMQLLFLETK